jgi:chemotaxis protein histidine kinase CheA
MPDPNTPLDPTGGMPDPNTPLDPTGGTPDPNTPLDPTGGMPDPNTPLDPTGGMPDPNTPLDPTGGMPDPNTPLDPTGGMPDPNTPLDPTGGAMVGAAGAADDDETESWGSTPIIIDPDRAELLQFMVTDVRTSATELEPILAEAYEFTSRQEAADRVVELANEMGKISEFFEFRSFETIIGIMREIGESLGSVEDAQLDEICIRLRALGSLLDQYCSGLEVGMELSWPFNTFRRRVGLLLSGQSLHPDLVAWHRGDPERVLELDRIVDGVEELPNPPSEVADGSAPAAAPSSAGGASQSAETKPADSKVPSVRVTQDSIEELFDIVRQLVLNKNQIESLAFDARVSGLSREKAEPLSLRAAEFSRLVERLQVSLSKTCVQPISVVLDRYERMVRDVAQLKEKVVDLEIVGAETRIDKFLLDQIADPIGRLLRDIASRSIETMAEREAAGKARSGRIRVEAADHESHITIDITHDGAAPDPAKILEEARALGTAPENLDELSPQEILLLPFRQWFETSETAGVAEAFAGHGGSVGVRTSDGETTYQIVLPVSGAVLGVMNVQVGSGIYAIPVRSIVEIISLNESTLQSVKGSPVLRVRDRVYPVITSAERFDESGESKAGVAVIVSSDKRSVALSVDRVIGHQEIVIEPIGLDRQQLGPFLGGAIRSDGSICLVVDVRRLIESDPRQVTEAAGELAGA